MTAGARPIGSPQPTQNYRDDAHIENSPSYCAFLPNNEAHPPAYYEQTTAKPIRQETEFGNDKSTRDRKEILIEINFIFINFKFRCKNFQYPLTI